MGAFSKYYCNGLIVINFDAICDFYCISLAMIRYNAWPRRKRLRLSPTGDPYGHPNPKWVLDGTVSVSNRVPICETHFGLQLRHNPNMSILSPGNLFAEMVLFLGPVVREN